MAFFGKVKNFFGIGTVTVGIESPDTFTGSQSTIDGKITVTGKSTQEVTEVKIELCEHWSTGSSDDKTEKHFVLGKQIVCSEPFSINEGEVKTFDFSVPFDLIKSKNDTLADSGGMMGALGKIGAALDGEKSKFKLVATADVKAATFDPNCEKVLKKV